MLQFMAILYDATTGEYIDSAPTNYTIATCTNTTKLSQLNMVTDEGTVTNIFTLTDFDDVGSGNGLNAATAIMYEAHRIHEETSEYHVLRLCTSWSKTDNIMEWNHNSPRSVVIRAHGGSLGIDYVIPWNENDTAHEVIQHTGHMFVSVSTIEALLSQEPLWIGSFYSDPNSVDIDTYLSYAAMSVLVSNSRYYAFATGTLLGTGSNGAYQFLKSIDGSAIVFWRKFEGQYNNYQGPVSLVPAVNIHNESANTDTRGSELPGWDGKFTPGNNGGIERWMLIDGIWWGYRAQAYGFTQFSTTLIVHTATNGSTSTVIEDVLNAAGVSYLYRHNQLGYYLQGSFEGDYDDGEPDSDVDPTNPDAPTPDPSAPDNPDPYYDPTSDPTNPDYDPTKDPDSPDYDPTDPHTPYRPPSEPSDPPEQEEHPPQDPIPTPETPPSYVTTNAMFTLYNPSGGDLTNLANFLWSPTWSIDTFKKIFANPLDCILGLMVMPHLSAAVSTKTMNVGNISTGVTMHYFTKQFYDFDCGTFELMEYYNSYLDYAPYTKVNIFLPYIGDKQLSTDEVMNKTLGVKYRFDLATGDCVAFVTVDGTVLYSFSGNCAARLPLAGNNWNGIIPAITGVAISAGSMAAGLPALGAASAAAVSTMKETISHTGSISGSAGLMGIQKPYLIVTRPRQAMPLNQNGFTGYPSFITESLGSLRGYTEVEECHLEHIPCTAAELEEIERLLKEGVLF